MNLVKEKWTRKDYEEYLIYLCSFYNEKNKKFGEKLINTKYEIIGMYMKEMRSIAKNIFKGNWQEFLKFTTNTYYEEVVIEGYVRELSKDINLIELFLPKIDNWAICDSLSLKYLTKNLDSYFDYFLNYLKDEREYYCRFGLIMLLGHYVSDKYIDRILIAIDKIESDLYYINMAQAWLLCECYVKCPSTTEMYLHKNNLNDFTQNKTISKIRESYRVDKDKKDYLNILKRKKAKA